jgi:hypothetical protein
MALCEFPEQPDAAGLFVCLNCGVALRERLRTRCAGKAPAKPQGIVKKAANYTGAVAKWIAAGKPTRDQAEVDRIYLEVCQPCQPHFKDGKCGKCGCAINREPNGLKNKIAMGTEHCPLDPPKW